MGASFASEPLQSERFRSSSGLIGILYPTPPELAPEADLDGNGFPDTWERLHFGVIGIWPSEDADMDGTSNVHEYLAGTDPRDNRSVFAPVLSLDGDTLVLAFSTVAGRTYRVLGGNQVSEPSVLAQVAGDGSVARLEISAPPGSDSQLFLRVELLIATESRP